MELYSISDKSRTVRQLLEDGDCPACKRTGCVSDDLYKTSYDFTPYTCHECDAHFDVCYEGEELERLKEDHDQVYHELSIETSQKKGFDM